MDDDTKTPQPTTAYPPWREAAEHFDAEPPPFGLLLMHEELRRLMSLPPEDKARSYAQESRDRLFYAHQIEDLKKHLLREHNRWLVSEHGKGYRVVEPHEYARLADQTFTAEIRAQFREWACILAAAPQQDMTDAQRKEADDSLARAVALKQSFEARRRELPVERPALPARAEEN